MFTLLSAFSSFPGSTWEGESGGSTSRAVRKFAGNLLVVKRARGSLLSLPGKEPGNEGFPRFPRFPRYPVQPGSVGRFYLPCCKINKEERYSTLFLAPLRLCAKQFLLSCFLPIILTLNVRQPRCIPHPVFLTGEAT